MKKHTAEEQFTCMAILNTCGSMQQQSPGWRMLFLSPQRSEAVWIKLHGLHGSVRMPFPIKSVNAFCFSNVDMWSQKCSTCACVAGDSFMHQWLQTHTRFHGSLVFPVCSCPGERLPFDNLLGLGFVCMGRHPLDGPLCLGGNLVLLMPRVQILHLFSYHASSVTSIFGLCGPLGVKCVNCALIKCQRGKHQVKNLKSWRAGSQVQWDRRSMRNFGHSHFQHYLTLKTRFSLSWSERSVTITDWVCTQQNLNLAQL